METLQISYLDSSGDMSQRRISDTQAKGRDAIEAFCHARGARRSFIVANIISATDLSTGEVIQNLWKAFGISKAENGREILISLAADNLQAIKALKFFALSTRGFGKRERSHLIEYVKQNISINVYTEPEIEEWLQQLWCGDVYAFKKGSTKEYESLLHSIPASQKSGCRSAAIAIAVASGRRQVASELIERIDREFSA